MKIDRTNFLKSSFLSAEKDMGLIISEILKNERLKKLLAYTDKNPLDHDTVEGDAAIKLFGNNIKMVPKVTVDDKERNIILIRFRNFIPSQTNPEFRDNIIEFDILCPYELWQLENFQLRPYRIAAELDATFDKKHLTGIGKLEFNGADQMILNDHFAGICLTYRAVHGDEDKTISSNDDEAFKKNFIEQLLNNKEDES